MAEWKVLPKSGTIKDADIAADAAIAQTKLALAIADAQVAVGAAIAEAKLALNYATHAKLHHEDHEAEGADALAAPVALAAMPRTFIEPTTASDTLQHSNDELKNTTVATYTKIKEIKLNASLSACRLKFDMRTKIGQGMVFARVYKNGVAVGIEQSTDSDTFVTKTEDFADWVAGDLIQIYAHDDGGDVCYVQNMRIYYDPTPIVLPYLPTNQDP